MIQGIQLFECTKTSKTKQAILKMESKKLKIAYMLLLGTIVIVANAKTMSNEKGKVRFIHQLEQGEKVKIAVLGTSLTGPWFQVMKEWLDETYAGQCSYFKEGVGGSASSYPPGKGGLDKVKIVTTYHPDVVFIEFAVNDAYKPYNITVEQSRKNLESIINTLKRANPEVEIILQTMNVVIDMPELNLTYSTQRSELSKYLKIYRQVAKERQLLLIDHYPNWKRYLKNEGRDTYTKIVPDGLHPSVEGYRKILLPELKKVLQ